MENVHYFCFQCDFYFEKISDLMSHLKYWHGLGNNNSVSCAQHDCQKIFSS